MGQQSFKPQIQAFSQLKSKAESVRSKLKEPSKGVCPAHDDLVDAVDFLVEDREEKYKWHITKSTE